MPASNAILTPVRIGLSRRELTSHALLRLVAVDGNSIYKEFGAPTNITSLREMFRLHKSNSRLQADPDRERSAPTAAAGSRGAKASASDCCPWRWEGLRPHRLSARWVPGADFLRRDRSWAVRYDCRLAVVPRCAEAPEAASPDAPLEAADSDTFLESSAVGWDGWRRMNFSNDNIALA
jgi:hypothetical protein